MLSYQADFFFGNKLVHTAPIKAPDNKTAQSAANDILLDLPKYKQANRAYVYRITNKTGIALVSSYTKHKKSIFSFIRRLLCNTK